jgi:hypothetical protein
VTERKDKRATTTKMLKRERVLRIYELPNGSERGQNESESLFSMRNSREHPPKDVGWLRSLPLSIARTPTDSTMAFSTVEAFDGSSQSPMRRCGRETF